MYNSTNKQDNVWCEHCRQYERRGQTYEGKYRTWQQEMQFWVSFNNGQGPTAAEYLGKEHGSKYKDGIYRISGWTCPSNLASEARTQKRRGLNDPGALLVSTQGRDRTQHKVNALKPAAKYYYIHWLRGAFNPNDNAGLLHPNSIQTVGPPLKRRKTEHYGTIFANGTHSEIPQFRNQDPLPAISYPQLTNHNTNNNTQQRQFDDEDMDLSDIATPSFLTESVPNWQPGNVAQTHTVPPPEQIQPSNVATNTDPTNGLAAPQQAIEKVAQSYTKDDLRFSEKYRRRLTSTEPKLQRALI